MFAKGVVDGVDQFDAKFFGYTPRDAAVMDPQHRIFLEICWEALENAGLDAERFDGDVGVFGGCYMDTYILSRLKEDADFRERVLASIQVGSLETEIGSDKDYLATRVAYKLGLSGPAMTVQTACSTSLVAVATACQHIETGACDAALAGGVSIVLPQEKEYVYRPGGMLSPDGRCRPLDAAAAGTVFSNGAAVVALKRLSRAMADRDTIYAVIRGYATNNDRSAGSFATPNPEGQFRVVAKAMDKAGIDARTIGYVESHGTATPTGEPVEIAALSKAYRRDTDERQYCAIGSVKANLGHLDVASGATGLIKAALCVHNGRIPPQIHFTMPNPAIGLERTPFFVAAEAQDFPPAGGVRRAAVSSFGVGGTNAHVILEEAPATNPEGNADDGFHCLPLSAKSPSALAAARAALANYLRDAPHVRLEDIAYTLQLGRRVFAHRDYVVARTVDGAFKELSRSSGRGRAASPAPKVVFLFPGQGAQRPGMGRDLYDAETRFSRYD